MPTPTSTALALRPIGGRGREELWRTGTTSGGPGAIEIPGAREVAPVHHSTTAWAGLGDGKTIEWGLVFGQLVFGII